uniref:PB1 domain-containing protein n=1 Tax=Vitis vinifera TaxID=29760 RepID=F6GSH5_VITVI
MGGDLDSASNRIIKFLYSYGGKILPRRIDGKLRYVGGHTRVLAVDRSISYAELMVKLGELCGSSVTLRCQLPKEDLDVLVTVTSDEELANVIDEYHRASSSCSKIRAVLSPPKSLKTISPVSSTTSSPLRLCWLTVILVLVQYLRLRRRIDGPPVSRRQ